MCSYSSQIIFMFITLSDIFRPDNLELLTLKSPCLGLAEANLAQILIGCASEYLSQIRLRRSGFTLKSYDL